MDPSSTGGFTNLLNSSTSSPEFQGPQSGYNQQYPNFPPPHFDHDFRPPPYRPIQSHYPHHFNPFGVQLGFQQFRGTSSYHGTPYHEGLMQFQQGSFRAAMACDPSSPVGSGGLFGGIGGSGSRADESESPISVPQPSHGVPVINQEQSESRLEEENKKSGRRLWSKPMNLRLVRAWLNNSNDPIQGVDKKYDHYWKDVAKEYNKHSPKEERRSASVLKNHWNRYHPIVMKFNHCWNRMKNTDASGESDDQIMVRAHAVFSNENSDKPFLLEYWWREVKGQPKWERVYPSIENKRTELNASGAYTSSSNLDMDKASAEVHHRPIGQKAAKAQKKGKGKYYHIVQKATYQMI